ncbi:MAG: hypothetical protein WC321_05630 [Candidatus Omnitrophota bacterium]|jgi:Tfp pilus assembly protein PilX
MLIPRLNKKGIALFIVLGTLLLIIVLANIILVIMLSHSRLTQHQVSRIQAQYASMAGLNYALEMLRLNNAPWTTAGTYNICNSNPSCNTLTPSGGCTANEPNLPCSVGFVAVTISGSPSAYTLRAKTTYIRPPAS